MPEKLKETCHGINKSPLNDEIMGKFFFFPFSLLSYFK